MFAPSDTAHRYLKSPAFAVPLPLPNDPSLSLSFSASTFLPLDFLLLPVRLCLPPPPAPPRSLSLARALFTTSSLLPSFPQFFFLPPSCPIPSCSSSSPISLAARLRSAKF